LSSGSGLSAALMLKFQPLSFAKTRMLQPQPKMFVRLPLRVMVLNEPLIRSPHHAASGSSVSRRRR